MWHKLIIYKFALYKKFITKFKFLIFWNFLEVSLNFITECCEAIQCRKA